MDFVVALTGGVASGKSAVASRFEALDVTVYDADVAARAVVEPGEPALAEIAAAFGTEVLDTDGRLNRRRLRERVFAMPAQRAALEAIVHPRVHTWLRERVAIGAGTYCVLAIPLLAETWPQYDWVDRVLVVDVPEDMQIARLVHRDGIDTNLARQMLAAQAMRAQRLAIADDVIDNSGPPETLDAAVAAMHALYLDLAQSN